MVQKKEFSRPKNKTKPVTLPLPLKLANESSWQVINLLQSFISYFKKTTPICTGTFMEFGRFIWIHDKSQFYSIYHAGFFGKGSLSRSDPTWFKRTEKQSGW
jgi:tRNA-splicing endonuclease subunit Sen2